ncbi:hypothetical protein J4E08_15820 [Sagittula sp. NFXS13]|uniref:hypothetical protein n=1 Tax=Sagittula sp. NFXS13 TaxID=2819095 RepID=UPI0032DEC7A9
MLVKSIEDALRLVLTWAGRADLPVPPRLDPPGLPAGLASVVSVSDALGVGAFTPNASPLLTTQDRILRPDVMRTDKGGYTTFIVENQGAFSLGFRRDDPGRLFLSGDWYTVPDCPVPTGWRSLPMLPEEALILTVLTNGFMGLTGRLKTRDEPDFDSVPADCGIQVWRHDAMGALWPGFWTDADRSRLYYGGMGMTLLL